MPDDATVLEGPLNPPENNSAQTISDSPPSVSGGPHFPKNIGRYRIVRLLGEGGMGAVYEAEQDQPRRSVALKVIKSAWADSDLLRRFHQEFQALGRLQHPGIAQIYEAGAADTGFGSQPFFAMEIIHGHPLTAYANAHHLTTPQRLALMVQVCEAVEHAHQRGIIHRDLKPGNILVDESGQPKILDFGLAHVTDSDAKATRQTDMGQLLGTLAYMSPEQVLADPLALDTRSDVYALGVVLYELLTNKMPYALTQNLHEVMQTIRETDPAALSSINRQYRGDIETIVAKALEKDRERRYGSAAELAADIQRYLQDLPILAKPASTSYRVQKFARRHKVLVTAGATVFLVLAAGAVISTWQAVRARRAEAVAKQETAIAKAVNQFLQDDLLSQADPTAQSGTQSAPDPDVKVRTLLDRAAAQVGKRFAGQPLVEAAIEKTIGIAYFGMGLFPQAEKHLRRAYDLNAAQLGADNPESLGILMEVSNTESNEGKNIEALAAAKTVLEGDSRNLGPENPKTVVAMQNLGALYLGTGQYAEAEPLLKKALDFQVRHNGYDNQDTLTSSDSLAELYIEQSRYAEASPYLAKGLNSYRRVFGPEHPATLTEMYGLAKVLAGEGRYPEAEKLFAEVLAVNQHVRGPRHPYTLNTAHSLAMVYVEEGRFAEAIALLQTTLDTSRQVAGPDVQDTLSDESALAWAYDAKGDLPRAQTLWESALQGYRTLGKDNVADVADVEDLLGQDLTHQGKPAQAEPLLRQALAFRQKQVPRDWQFFRTEAFLGGALAGEGRDAEAEPLLRDGYNGLQRCASRMPAKQKKWTRVAGEQLAKLKADTPKQGNFIPHPK